MTDTETIEEEYHPHPLSYYEIHLWSLQLHVMLGAGLPLVGALELIAVSELPRLSATCALLSEQITAGHRLSEAMNSLEPTFSSLVINLVAVGEKSGRLAQVFERISERSFRRDKTHRSVRAALAYPLFLAAVSVAMAFFMAFYMFPKLLPFLMGLRVTLPWPTRALIWGTDHLASYFLIFTVLAGWLGGMLASNAHPRVVKIRDWLLYKSPVLGKINSERVYADCLSDLSMLLEAQCDLLGSLRALQPPWAEQRERILLCVQEIRAGSSFSHSIEASGVLPSRFMATLHSAEESGLIANTCRLLSQQLEESVSMELERLVQLIEPAIMGGMGLVTGFIVLATFLPLYSMVSTNL